MSTDFSITYKEGYLKLAAFTDANWGENPDDRKSTSSYIIMLSNGPISFKVDIQVINFTIYNGGGIGGGGSNHEEISLLQQYDA